MKTSRPLPLKFVIVAIVFCFVTACSANGDDEVSADVTSKDTTSNDTTSSADLETQTPKLKWFQSCGDPVCGPGVPATTASKCTTEKVGDPCTTAAKTCDAGFTCGAVLICAKHDPRAAVGGCPRSQRQVKAEIRYVSTDELAGFHRELMAIRLATYRYKTAPTNGPRHLGFIIEDTKSQTCVGPKRERVNLYGYTSMAVASLQLQAKKIAVLEREIASLKALVGKLLQSRTPPATN